MRKKHVFYLAGIVAVIGMISWTGCATKKYVQTELVTLDQKVEGVEGGVEENQKRLREHDEQLATIGSVIKEHEAELATVDGKIDSKFEEAKKYARGNLIFKETLRNSEAKFKFDSYELSRHVRSKVDRAGPGTLSRDTGSH